MISKSLLAVVLLVSPLLCDAGNLRRQVRQLGQEPIGPLPDWDGPCEGAFPDPDDCRQFIECWAGEATLWTCTERMLFDLEYYGCNYAQYTHCYERPRPTDVPSTQNPPATTVPTTTSNVTTSTTPAPPIDYTCPEGDGVFAHEERCEYYWNCYAGDVQLIHCQGDYLFDRRYNGCNFPEMTDCDHRERPDGSGSNPTTRPTQTTTVRTTTEYTGPTTPEVEPTFHTGPSVSTTTTTTRRPGGFECPVDAPDGNHADPDDCTAFFTCVGGIAYRNQCPIPLYYSIPGDMCDYRNNVDCGTRP
ncbi:probable endochitinase [Folsomia candida]|uniref:Putative chitinase 3 n=1 Tax=Folsomia candida TaxID=158441 RepID=A0A226EVX3_FOLCA|nr:probable endochitinase [Folsomia candida]OXA61317.1 putative chitinase 3 [Folsomia candida]